MTIMFLLRATAHAADHHKQFKACATKIKGQWTCATCHLSFARLEFSAWLRRRQAGQDGTQECNHCVQALAIDRAAARARRRLEAHRRKTRQRAILAQIRAEIASVVQKRNDHSAKRQQPPAQPNCSSQRRGTIERKRTRQQNRDDEDGATAAGKRRCVFSPSQHEGRKDAVEGRQTRIEYKCPYCHATIQSTVRNGLVTVTGHCGKQFRVRDGVVARGNTQPCPKCGAKIQSTLARGQIWCKHKTPNGKVCPTTRWYVK